MDDGILVISDFDIVVNLDIVGSYIVMLNVEDESGNKVDLVIIIVIVVDIEKLIIIVDIMIIYVKGIIKIVV